MFLRRTHVHRVGMANYIKYLVISLLAGVLILSSPAHALKDKKQKTPKKAVVQEKVEQPKLVGRISFEDVLKRAKEHSYDLQIADYNVLIAKQDIRGARSEYFPKLNFMAGTEYTRNFRDINDTTIMSVGDAFINPYTRFQSVMGIVLSYNLFDFGARKNKLQIAKEDTALRELEVQQELQEMSLTLLDSYTKILITTKQIEHNEEILALEEKTLEMKERLFNAKEISKTEYNDAKASVAKTKAKISDLKYIREDALNWLSFYTGDKYDANTLKIDELKKTDFDVLAFQDYTRSVIWKMHEKNIKKKELELSIAKKNYLPKVNAYGRYYMYASDHSNYGKALGIEPSNMTFGASLSMPVFDGFQNSALVQKTELELKQLHIERNKAIAEFMTRLASMRSNLVYLDEQVNENAKALNELSDKEKSIHRLASKKVASPLDENEAKIELLNQQIELEKNSITQIAITRGIQILTEENK